MVLNLKILKLTQLGLIIEAYIWIMHIPKKFVRVFQLGKELVPILAAARSIFI
jgi:hypothetical protein